MEAGAASRLGGCGFRFVCSAVIGRWAGENLDCGAEDQKTLDCGLLALRFRFGLRSDHF